MFNTVTEDLGSNVNLVTLARWQRRFDQLRQSHLLKNGVELSILVKKKGNPLRKLVRRREDGFSKIPDLVQPYGQPQPHVRHSPSKKKL